MSRLQVRKFVDVTKVSLFLMTLCTVYAAPPVASVSLQKPIIVAGDINKVVAANWGPCVGSPNPLSLYDLTSGTAVPITTIPLSGDPKAPNAPCVEVGLNFSAGLGGFNYGDVFVASPANAGLAIQIFKLAGSTLTPFGAPIPVAVGTSHIFLNFDTVGTFGYNMLVTSAEAVQVFLVNSSGVATQLAFTGSVPFKTPSDQLVQIESPRVAPSSFGPNGGQLWLTGEDTGKIYAVTPAGVVTTLTGNAGGPESIVFVPSPLSCSVLVGPPGAQHSASLMNPNGQYVSATLVTDTVDFYDVSAFPGAGFVNQETGPPTSGQIDFLNTDGSAGTTFDTPHPSEQWRTAEHMNGIVCPPPACLIPPSGTAIGGSAVSWNKFNPKGTGNVVWIHAHIGTPSGVPTTTVTTVQFTGVTFVLNSVTYALPDGVLIFDPAAPATPTTTFDSGALPNGRWVTTLNPSHLSDEIFFDGAAIPVDSNISGGGQATFNYTTQSSDNNLAFNWQWSAAVFTFWPGNNAANILPSHQSDHAGTPENKQVQNSLIQGPRGGGGSNYTGSWSGTGQGTCPGATHH